MRGRVAIGRPATTGAARRAALGAAAVAALLAMGCTTPGVPGGLVGDWTSLSVDHPEFFGRPLHEEQRGAIRLHIGEDGRFHGAAEGRPVEGTIQLRRGRLVLTDSDGEVSHWRYARSGDRLELVSLEDGFRFVFERDR